MLKQSKPSHAYPQRGGATAIHKVLPHSHLVLTSFLLFLSKVFFSFFFSAQTTSLIFCPSLTLRHHLLDKPPDPANVPTIRPSLVLPERKARNLQQLPHPILTLDMKEQQPSPFSQDTKIHFLFPFIRLPMFSKDD